jgi:hypothetical protein
MRFECELAWVVFLCMITEGLCGTYRSSYEGQTSFFDSNVNNSASVQQKSHHHNSSLGG